MEKYIKPAEQQIRYLTRPADVREEVLGQGRLRGQFVRLKVRFRCYEHVPGGQRSQAVKHQRQINEVPFIFRWRQVHCYTFQVERVIGQVRGLPSGCQFHRLVT